MYATIDTGEFERQFMINDWCLLDFRERNDFLSGHIPGAINIPIDELTITWQNLDQKKPYYVICYKGNRSLQAARFLSMQGFRIFNIQGGMKAWKGKVYTTFSKN